MLYSSVLLRVSTDIFVSCPSQYDFFMPEVALQRRQELVGYPFDIAGASMQLPVVLQVFENPDQTDVIGIDEVVPRLRGSIHGAHLPV